MGIESEQLVFDYLSRVGDLAHGTSMTAAERARLVSGLRGEIDRMRAADGGAESKAAVRRILGKLGKPEEVVSAANGGPVSPGGLRDVADEGGSGSGGRGPFGGTGGFGGLGSSLGGLGASLGGLGTSLSSSLSSSLGSSLSGRGARGSKDARDPGGSGSARDGSARDGAASRDGDGRAGHGVEDGPSVPFVPDQRDPSYAPVSDPDANPGSDPGPERAPTPPPRDYSSPHLAGMDELGPEESNPDWWRTDPSPFGLGDGMGAGPGTGAGGLGEQVPGFVGGIELPEVLKPPPVDGMGDGRTSPGPGPSSPPGPPSAPGAPGPPVTGASTVPAAEPGMGGAGGKEAGAGAVAGAALRRMWPGRAGRGRNAAEGPRAGGIVEVGAAVLLVAGALFGSLIPLAVGWLAAWWSPRLSRTEAKWAAAGMPGLVAAGTAVWIWGRIDGRWGEPLAEGGEALQTALSDAFPVLLRVAAVASALFLVWCARRVAP